MKKDNSSLISINRFAALLTCVFIAVCLTPAAYSQVNSNVLLVQLTPAKAGTVTPDAGIHNLDINSEVALTATPNPGYHFVYWLGDVTDPTSNTAVAYLDSPKIIIAVFEKNEFQFTTADIDVSSKSMPNPAIYGFAPNHSGGGGSGAGGKRPHKFRYQGRTEPNDEDDPIPVPGDFPIPEPATVLLFLGGSLFITGRYRKNKN